MNEWYVGSSPFRGRCNCALKQALCATSSTIRLKEPCSFTKVLDGPYFGETCAKENGETFNLKSGVSDVSSLKSFAI